MSAEELREICIYGCKVAQISIDTPISGVSLEGRRDRRAFRPHICASVFVEQGVKAVAQSVCYGDLVRVDLAQVRLAVPSEIIPAHVESKCGVL